jgi:hypothetical protein
MEKIMHTTWRLRKKLCTQLVRENKYTHKLFFK